jgi:hypothetical protein
MYHLTTYFGIIWYHLIYQRNHYIEIPSSQQSLNEACEDIVLCQGVQCPLSANSKSAEDTILYQSARCPLYTCSRCTRGHILCRGVRCPLRTNSRSAEDAVLCRGSGCPRLLSPPCHRRWQEKNLIKSLKII